MVTYEQRLVFNEWVCVVRCFWAQFFLVIFRNLVGNRQFWNTVVGSINHTPRGVFMSYKVMDWIARVRRMFLCLTRINIIECRLIIYWIHIFFQLIINWFSILVFDVKIGWQKRADIKYCFDRLPSVWLFRTHPLTVVIPSDRNIY